LALLALVALACEPRRARAVRTVELELGPVPASAARVCVLRPDDLASDVTMEMRDNGRLVGATRGATFVCWLAAPGPHQITSIDDDTGPTFFRARAGAEYWLHQEVAVLGGEVHAHLDWVDDRVAADMLDACNARVRVAIPGRYETDGVAVSPRQ
jgi:hypothetical protein